MDEGYIKFRANWTKAPPLPEEELRELNCWRNRMYDLKLIGVYDDGVGYGNISRRWDADGRFIISGSATGNLEKLGPEHYSLVTEVDIDQNRLTCRGPAIASSESMSHAVVYQECPEVNAVIHIHHLGIWKTLLHLVPTTCREATYGSPEMARSIIRLLRETDLRISRLFVMEGHREGVFAFGETLDEAGERASGLLSL
jgi:L-ribulose-5-phosphate 4-epimerase